MIAKKVNSIADPEWPRRISLELDEPAEISFAVRIDPEIACGAAVIALPERSFDLRPSDDDAAIWTI